MTAHTTAVGAPGFVVAGAPSKTEGGFFKRVFDQYTETLVKAGRARAMRELHSLSDSHLEALGLTKDQVASFRASGSLPRDFWA